MAIHNRFNKYSIKVFERRSNNIYDICEQYADDITLYSI